MLNDLANLSASIIRIFVTGAVVFAVLIWLIITLADMEIFPWLIGSLPVVVILWAFSKRG